MIRWLKDQILAHLQRDCDHPGNMISADILEGSVAWHQVKHCRRCGATKVVHTGHHGNSSVVPWRVPDPNLWRG